MNDAPECFRAGDVRLVKNRHVTDCRSRDCDGCVECTERHCAVCRWRHLEPLEAQTCPRCVGQLRMELLQVVDLVPLARSELDGYPSASSGTVRTGRSNEEPIPGGDILVMLAGGSEGTEALRGLLAGDEHALDHELASDPIVVLTELAWWEDRWREQLGHPPAIRRDLTAVHRYLYEHLPQAAQLVAQHSEDELPDFPEFTQFVRRLRRLHGGLEAARRDSNRPMRGVKCFDCDTTLTRALRTPDPCGHREPSYVALPDVQLVGPHGYPHTTTAAERRAAWEEFDAAYTAYLIDHMACDQGGFADQWECTTCGVTYDKARYWRAVRQAHEDLQHDQQPQNGHQEDAS